MKTFLPMDELVFQICSHLMGKACVELGMQNWPGIILGFTVNVMSFLTQKNLDVRPLRIKSLLLPLNLRLQSII